MVNTQGFSVEKVLLKSTPPTASARGSASTKRMKFPEAYEVEGVAQVVLTPPGNAQVVLGAAGSAHVAAATLGDAHVGVVALVASTHVKERRAFRLTPAATRGVDPRWSQCVQDALRANHRCG